MTAVLGGLLVFLFALAVRLGIIWPHRHRGCDAYYFLLSSEEFRRYPRLPITLPPVYVLESLEQWYPPGFSVFLAMLPKRLLEKCYWVVSPSLDSLIAAGVYGLVFLVSGNATVGLLAGAVYAINGASLPDTTSLSSRPLAALLFSVALMGLILGASDRQPMGFFMFYVFGGMLLFTHKLSSQLLYFLVPFMGIASGNWLYGLSALAIPAAMILSPGMLVKVWKGQADILLFWAKNWKQLGAHQIYGSAMYPGYEDRDTRRVHDRGWKGLWKGAPFMAMNTFALPAALVTALHYAGMGGFDRQMVFWATGTYLWAGLTQFLSPLKFLGEGYRYLKLASLPVSYLAVLPLVRQWETGEWYWMTLTIAGLGAAAVIARLFGFFTNRTGTTVPFVDKELIGIARYLRNTRTENILCVPDSLGDAIGYYSRKRVLRGTHNYPFKTVAPFFPTYRLPIAYLAKGYQVSHIVVYKTYVDPKVLEMDEFAELELETEEYCLYRVAKKETGVV